MGMSRRVNNFFYPNAGVLNERVFCAQPRPLHIPINLPARVEAMA